MNRYTGRRYDAETGLYYYRARTYSPKLGRFLQVDPIGTQDNMNLYGYTANDPVNATDPSGEATCRFKKATYDIIATVNGESQVVGSESVTTFLGCTGDIELTPKPARNKFAKTDEYGNVSFDLSTAFRRAQREGAGSLDPLLQKAALDFGSTMLSADLSPLTFIDDTLFVYKGVQVAMEGVDSSRALTRNLNNIKKLLGLKTQKRVSEIASRLGLHSNASSLALASPLAARVNIEPIKLVVPQVKIPKPRLRFPVPQ